MKLRITTFNLENLFNRYALLDEPWENRTYEKLIQAVGLVSIASRAGDLVPYVISEIQRNNTAQAVLDSAPDILAVQEIENLYTLRIFNQTFLDQYFDRMIAIDGNDPRGIDVGLMIRKGLKVDISNIRTHIDEPEKGKSIKRTAFLNLGYMVTGAVFSRDCLEVDLVVNGKVVTLLVNHFKAQDGSASSVKRRTAQANRVAQLTKDAADAGKLPIVLGDLNVDPKTDNSLDGLLKSNVLKDPFKTMLAASEQWTHYYVPAKKVSRLDYVLPHKNIQVDSVEVLRKGLTTKAKQYTGPRYPTIGPEHTEASDHCPTTVVVDI
jgi:endonuclease/exonuclease/phosphatase family metal-dependent hydrolase